MSGKKRTKQTYTTYKLESIVHNLLLYEYIYCNCVNCRKCFNHHSIEENVKCRFSFRDFGDVLRLDFVLIIPL